MGIPGVKLSVTVLNDFKNKGSWGTIFMNGYEMFTREILFSSAKWSNENEQITFTTFFRGRETIDMLPFGQRARLKAMSTIQAVKDFNEA